jgi:DNA adenine methylase
MVSPLKWLGSKRFQLDHIIPKLNDALKDKSHYYEPFLGGGSVIIELLKQNTNHDVKYICSDINEMVIGVFNEIKYSPYELLDKLKQYSSNTPREEYYRIRDEYNQTNCIAKFMYLNKTCFRGLYRVNKRGEFNVSFNYAKNPDIYCESNILELHKLFNSVDITFEVNDYRNVEICDNSASYLDPPYYDNYNTYSQESFDYTSYIDYLRNILQNPNIKLIHSNSNSFRKIYESKENIEEIILYNRINCKDPSSTRVELLYF